MQVNKVEKVREIMAKGLVCTPSKLDNQNARPLKAHIVFENSLHEPYLTVIQIGSQSDDGSSASTASKMTAELHYQHTLGLVLVLLKERIIFLENLLKLLLCIILYVLSLHALRQENKLCSGMLCG